MIALAAIPADALTTGDLAWLGRLLSVFADDLEFEIRPDHIRSAWRELGAEDRGEGVIHHDTRREERAARRARGALP